MANLYKSVLASGGGVEPTGNAQPADVLATKTFSNADGVGKVGTMVNNGAVSGVATASQPYTVPAGYHNGSGVVTASYSPSKTTLWTNPTPSNNWGNNEITLSQDMTSFDYLEIEFAYGPTALSRTTKILVDPTDLPNWLYSSTDSGFFGGLGIRSTTVYMARPLTYVNSTKLRIGDCYELDGSTAHQNAAIPITVKGIKF